jgi:tripartite-type tricarboxylate transporter receptor subunit TctC
VKYVRDAAKAVVDSPEFAKTMDARGVDVDDREGERLRADLWREYKLDAEILKRIGLIKPQ